MSQVIIVTSPFPNAGKTTVAMVLGRRLRRHARVQYRRLLGPSASADAVFARSTLRLAEAAPSLIVGDADLTKTLDTDCDVLLIEADLDSPGLGQISALARDNVHFLIVARYTPDQFADKIEQTVVAVGGRASVVINAVPEKGMRATITQTVPTLVECGSLVFGVIPQERSLIGLTAGDLAGALGAHVLCGDEGLDNPIESLMIAAMSDEGANEYFARMQRKVVVAGGDRPDVHMPALSTDTACIVLTEGREPDPTVFKTAEEQGVPLLLVQPGTIETLDRVSDALEAARFRQPFKLAVADAVWDGAVDTKALLASLGLAEHPA